MSNDLKPTNPKDAVGIRKAGLSAVPSQPLYLLGLAMLEGARKYGRHNYRAAGIRYSVYYDAMMRHMQAWWEGEDIDPDSGLPHPAKAMACLVVLLDGMLMGNATDDRPPAYPEGWMKQLHEAAGKIIDAYPDAKAPFLEKDSAGAHQRAVEAMIAQAYPLPLDQKVSTDTKPDPDTVRIIPCQSCHLADDNPVFEGIGRCRGCVKRLDVV